MNRTILNLAAMCDRAGRPVNQDNYFVCQDLSASSFSSVNNDDKDVVLSDKGALVVVADGMGGMNAGEVASKIVIETIKSVFSAIPDDILKDEKKIKGFINQAIISADREVKQYAKEHSEASGMGSTIVILWLLNDKAYIGWCGDSRAYCFNPKNSLVRLTHDHSYVQDLVDQEKISEADAFDHPDSNIITRSLGDSGQRANPDVEVYPIHKDDVFLLCSDGLCGLLKDSEIQSIIGMNWQSMKGCLMALWNQGIRTGWTDNATVELVRIKECKENASEAALGWTNKHSIQAQKHQSQPSEVISPLRPNRAWIYYTCAALLIGCVLGYLLSKATPKSNQSMSSKDEQISYLQKEVTRLNSQVDSLQKVINRSSTSQSQSRPTNTSGSNSRQQNQTRGTTQNRQEPRQSSGETPSPHDNNPAITEVPVEHEEQDFSKLDPNYLSQIRSTVRDFESLKVRIETVAQSGVLTVEQYSEMSQRWKDINQNVGTIQNNDSYKYLDDDTKQSINEIKSALPNLKQTLEQLKPQGMQAVRIRGNGNSI